MTSKTLKGGVLSKKKMGFSEVVKMIDDSTSTVSALSVSSLKGFVFKVHTKKPGPFLAFNEKSSTFNKKVTNIILKIVILEDEYTEEKIELDPLIIGDSVYEKDTEFVEAYAAEAKTQQAIFKSSVFPSGHPICPSVIDFSAFDKKAALKILQKLKNKAGRKKAHAGPTTITLNYLMDQMHPDNPSTGIAIISMELLDFPSIEILSFEGGETYDRAAEYALAQLLRLFLKDKIIHTDCHLGNVLTDGKKSMLIDFGSIIDLSTFKVVDEQTAAFVEIYNSKSDTTFDEDSVRFRNLDFTSFMGSKPNLDEINEVFKFIACVDYAMNKSMFDEVDSPKMNTLLFYLYSEGSLVWDSSDRPKNEYVPKLHELASINKRLTELVSAGMSRKNMGSLKRLTARKKIF
jgi:hypothetical protein